MNRREYLQFTAASMAGAFVGIPKLDAAEQINRFTQVDEFEMFCLNHASIPSYLCDQSDKRFVLMNHQKRLVEMYATENLVIATKFRNGGFSTVSALWLLHHVFKNQSHCGIMCMRESDAMGFQCAIDKMIHNLPYKNKESHMLMEFKGGGTLRFLYPDASRGKLLNAILMDEPAYWRNATNTWKEIYPNVSGGAKVFAVSTPYKNKGWFYETYRDAERGKNKFKVFHAHFLAHPKHTGGLFSRLRKDMRDKDFQREILQNFVA